MPQTEYTKTELARIIKAVESEFTEQLKKAESTTMAKSEDGEKEEKPEKESPKDSEEHEHSEKKPEKESESHEDHEDSHDYDDEDMKHMHEMYGSMSKGELKAHHDAVKRCLDALEGHAGGPTGEPDGSPGEKEIGHDPEPIKKAEHSDGLIKPQPPKGSPGAQSQASKDQKNLSDLEKAEEERTRESGGKIEKTPGPKGSPGAQSPASKDQRNLSDMEKSEKTEFDLVKSELESIKSEKEKLQKTLDSTQEFLTKLVSKIPAPKGKAITEIGVLAKTEEGSQVTEMSKSEITSRLLAKSRDMNTTPADRAAINAFYLNGADVSTISHLLK